MLVSIELDEGESLTCNQCGNGETKTAWLNVVMIEPECIDGVVCTKCYEQKEATNVK